MALQLFKTAAEAQASSKGTDGRGRATVTRLSGGSSGAAQPSGSSFRAGELAHQQERPRSPWLRRLTSHLRQRRPSFLRLIAPAPRFALRAPEHNCA